MTTVGELKQLLNQYSDEDIIYLYDNGIWTLFDKDFLEIRKKSDVTYKRDGYDFIREWY